MNKALKVRKHFIVLAVVILLQSSLVSLASGMSDVEGHWAEREIHYAIEENWMRGYSDSEFGANEPLTRAEMAVVLSRILNLSPKTASFTDVPQEHWAALSISAVSEEGYMMGYPDGSFSPNSLISREELAATLVRAFPLTVEGEEVHFSDVASERWSFEAIQTLVSNGIVSGYPDGTFQPTQPVTRAELAVILQRMMDSSKRIWNLQAIKNSLTVGMTQEEVIHLFGESYHIVDPVLAQPGPVWRYDLGTQEDYEYDAIADSIDLEGLREQQVQYQLFLNWSEKERLEHYTIYYADGAGIYEYRMRANGESETTQIR